MKEPKNRVLFEQLETLVQAREDTELQIRRSEKEVSSLYIVMKTISSLQGIINSRKPVVQKRYW